MDELYKTGKTTFRDDGLVHKDYVVEFNDLVASWALVNNGLLADIIKYNWKISINHTFKCYVRDELKQLCIDYYGEE